DSTSSQPSRGRLPESTPQSTLAISHWSLPGFSPVNHQTIPLNRLDATKLRGISITDNKKGRVVTRPFGNHACRLAAKVQSLCLRHLMRTRLICRSIRGEIGCADELIGQEVGLNLFTTHVGQHVAVNFHTGTKHLTALFDHFLTLHRIVDDIAIFKCEVVLAHDGTHALAPATGRFQISDNLR